MSIKQYITVPRIIGIILIVIAVLAYQTQGRTQVTLLALAGLVLLCSPTRTAQKHWQAFLASLKPGKETMLIMLFDIIFWAALAILTLILANVLQSPYEQLKALQLGSSATISMIASYNDILQGVFTTALITLIIFWMLVVAAYSFSRGLIWLTLLEKPVQRVFFTRFSLLNLIWCTAWIILTVFFLSTTLPQIAAHTAIIVMVLYAHLATVLHYSYTKTRALGKSFRDTFGIGLGNAAHFIHPYCYLFIVYVILSQIARVAQGTTALIVTFIVFLIFMALYRTYLRNILRHIA